jgi:hypothetical protein
VTLEITNNDKDGFDVEDVDLVLQFEQSHETTKNVIERTVYSYTDNFYDSESGTFTTTAAQAYEKNFAGYTSVVTGNNVNPTLNGRVVQDCNTDVWFIDKLQDDATNTSDGVVDSDIKTQVIMLSGKLYISDAGKYRFSIRGRRNVALYLSVDNGKTYQLAAEYTNTAGASGFSSDDGTYKDLELDGDSWVYFKTVLIRYYGEDRNAFMGLGWGKWTEAEGEFDYDADGNIIVGEDYVAPTVSVSYATAYRASYVSLPEQEYTHDYLYTRKYNYTYAGITTYDVAQELITEHCQYNTGWGHDLQGLVDGNSGTYAHTDFAPSQDRPAVIEAKLASKITANRIIFDGSHHSENKFLPKTFKIWVSTDGENWQLVCDVAESEMTSDGWQVIADFDKLYTFSYYKFEIYATHNQYIALRKIIFQKYDLEIEGGSQITPDNSMFTYDGNWSTKSVYSTFGHVYVGQEGATAEFEFEGTRLAILSTTKLGTNFKVEIDGVEVSSIDLVENTGIGASYVSQELKSGKHTVKITCTGEANIDSIAIW